MLKSEIFLINKQEKDYEKYIWEIWPNSNLGSDRSFITINSDFDYWLVFYKAKLQNKSPVLNSCFIQPYV